MKVILVRHGEAERETLVDSERQLTKVGHQQAVAVAQALQHKYTPDQFIVSPYIRAQQTLAALTKLCPNVSVNVCNNITPSDNALTALNDLSAIQGDCIIVVCHMPIVAKLAALLTGSSPEPFALAEARVFDAPFIAENMATEIERVIPNQ